jgi:hypothetical protein
MRYRLGLVLGSLALVGLTTWGSEAAPPGAVATAGDSSTLTVDVIPLQAEVRLNGVSLGTAHDLVYRAIPILPGWHVLEVTAPGYLSARVDVSATADWPTRIWVQLVPDRGE